MFENPRRGRQARNFTTNALKILDLKSSPEQIFLENWRWVPLITSTLCLKNVLLFLNGFGIRLNGSGYPFQKKLSSICTAWAIRLEKIVVHLNSLGYPVKKKNQCHPFEQLGLSVWKKIVICSNRLGYLFQKIVIRLNGLGYQFFETELFCFKK